MTDTVYDIEFWQYFCANTDYEEQYKLCPMMLSLMRFVDTITISNETGAMAGEDEIEIEIADIDLTKPIERSEIVEEVKICKCGVLELECGKCDGKVTYDYKKQKWFIEMTKYDKLVSETYTKAVNTKDEDLKIGDIVEQSLGCRDYRFVQVDKLTAKTILFKVCNSVIFNVRDSGGDTHTYSRYINQEFENGYGTIENGVVQPLYFRKKRHTKVLDNEGDEKWRGRYVFNRESDIWIKSAQSDIMR